MNRDVLNSGNFLIFEWMNKFEYAFCILSFAICSLKCDWFIIQRTRIQAGSDFV